VKEPAFLMIVYVTPVYVSSEIFGRVMVAAAVTVRKVSLSRVVDDEVVRDFPVILPLKDRFSPTVMFLPMPKPPATVRLPVTVDVDWDVSSIDTVLMTFKSSINFDIYIMNIY